MKYELTNETKEAWGGFEPQRKGVQSDKGTQTLHRIRALIDIPSKGVRAGDLGGWVRSYENLSQEGSCWVSDDAAVCDSAYVSVDALVKDKARLMDYASVRGGTVGGESLVIRFGQMSGGLLDGLDTIDGAHEHQEAEFNLMFRDKKKSGKNAE